MWRRLGTIMITGWRVERAGVEKEGGGAISAPAYGWYVRRGGKKAPAVTLHRRRLSLCPVDKSPPTGTQYHEHVICPFKSSDKVRDYVWIEQEAKASHRERKRFSLNVRNLIISSTSWISSSKERSMWMWVHTRKEAIIRSIIMT